MEGGRRLRKDGWVCASHRLWEWRSHRGGISLFNARVAARLIDVCCPRKERTQYVLEDTLSDFCIPLFDSGTDGNKVTVSSGVSTGITVSMVLRAIHHEKQVTAKAPFFFNFVIVVSNFTTRTTG